MNSTAVLVDAHVHLHPCFRLSTFLERAAANLEGARSSMGLGETALYAMLLTESAGDEKFRELREGDASGDPGGAWRIEKTTEGLSLVASRIDGPSIVLVAGRQVATLDGLEVLALCCDAGFPDGRPIRETMETVREAGGLPAVPWGFGKWWGDRGKLLERLMREESPAVFYLGDNGGRPRMGGRPRAFALADRLGIRILPGSDPLPFRSHESRAGSYGFVLRTDLDPDRLGGMLKEALQDPSLRPEPFGRGQGFLSFVRNQILMHARKRLTRSGA